MMNAGNVKYFRLQEQLISLPVVHIKGSISHQRIFEFILFKKIYIPQFKNFRFFPNIFV